MLHTMQTRNCNTHNTHQHKAEARYEKMQPVNCEKMQHQGFVKCVKMEF